MVAKLRRAVSERTPSALVYLIAAILIGATIGVSGYLLGRESRADEVRAGDELRRSLASRNADDAVQQQNTLLRIKNLCQGVARLPNKVGPPLNRRECNQMVLFGHLVTPASIEVAAGGRLAFVCFYVRKALGEDPKTRDIDAECERGTRLLPSAERELRNPP
jgi:hypothetical protein